jgi:hypothetical protein
LCSYSATSQYFLESKIHYHIHKSPPLDLILCQINPVHNITFLVMSFLLDLPPVFYMHSSSHPFMLHVLPNTPSPDHSNHTWQRVNVMKLLSMQHMSNLLPLLLINPSILLSTLLSNTQDFFYSLNVRDNIPLSLMHTHKTICKIVVLYILVRF